MVIKPKVRGFVCITSHPQGCVKNVENQISYVASAGTLAQGPKNVLVIGSSTGYGLASRIAAGVACGANTLGVYFERPGAGERPGSAGWYNSLAYERYAQEKGLYAKSINGDAFSNEIREETLQAIREDMGKVDLVVYSLASPRRTDPETGEVFKSVLKPIGETFTGKTVNTDKNEVYEVSIDPASEDDIAATQKVMGGEDWELWMQALIANDLLSEGAQTVAYSYIGPEVTWPVYKNGTIGKAKESLDASVIAINEALTAVGGKAFVSVNKAVVTQASSAIPVVPLYNSLLFKVMKAKGLHEGCIEQIYRLFQDYLYTSGEMPALDDAGRIRIDDWEMREDVQQEVAAVWPQITTENLRELTDYSYYQEEFLSLFGFGLEGVDYEADVSVEGI